MSVNEKMMALADAIRNKTGETQKLTLDAMAAAVEQVFEGGRQAAREDFWDSYQQMGNRTDYAGAFGGHGWNNELFFPKYAIRPTNAMYMFRTTKIAGDLEALLQERGITLDFSECTNAVELFSNAPDITRVGVVDMRKVTNASNAFAYCGVKTIDKVILSENTSVMNFPGAATELEHLTVEGTIGKSGFDTRYCKKLNKESIQSIVEALSTQTNGLNVTFSRDAVDNAFAEGSMENGDYLPGSMTSGWNDMLELRPNWNMELI